MDESATVVVRPGEVLRMYKKQHFTTRDECKKFVQDFALRQGKRAVVVKEKSGGRNSRKKDVKGFFISSFNANHHGCTGSKKPTQRQVAEVQVARLAVSANAKTPAKILREQVEASEGMSISKRMTYRARDEIVVKMKEDNINDFKKVQSLLERFCELNPSSHFNYEEDEQGRFARAFLSHPFVKRHQQHGQAILGIDGTFMKHDSYRETMLILVGRDGNNTNVILAVALCSSEDGPNCKWFLKHCKEAGVVFDNVPLFSDRGRALFSAVEAMDGAMLPRYCTRHIIGNIIGAYATPKDLKELVYAIQGAETAEEFQRICSDSSSHIL